MQFTPQQLAGAGRYSHKTRIGNWCEDLAIEEVKLNDFMSNKRNGTLLTMQAGQRAELAYNQWAIVTASTADEAIDRSNAVSAFRTFIALPGNKVPTINAR